MSALGGQDINVLVKALAAHVKRAAESGAGGATAPGDPPVQSAPVGAGAGKSTAESCKVCGRSSLHDGQRGAKVISEEDWYGLFEGDDLYADRTKIEGKSKSSLQRCLRLQGRTIWSKAFLLPICLPDRCENATIRIAKRLQSSKHAGTRSHRQKTANARFCPSHQMIFIVF